ncbi:hypothetical protein Phum_PHUM237340 [Pediculus humanus corporis]|uniref:Uncharacterized protein n=1 Tax=Pediculus humanus subsp. corporis TaxID=121224 RepID=E0VJ23_PEDHC|nr:uncharacterized protein Phum_PHUM237340 [Pediculus humanus corporis]EEB13379.1 hypothetical protein Phum_PHUM237340 [Pediculus humanus corporis]
MYNVKNCFGFEEEDANISLWNNSSVLSSTLAPIEFQADKPYRLALYIKPTHKNVNSTKKNKSGRKVNVMLFDENVVPPNDKKTEETSPKKIKNDITSFLKNSNTSKKNVLTELNSKPVAKSKQYKVRKSYERKCKGTNCDVIAEKASDEIIKELEIKKLSKTKLKKSNKEDQEFEKWASDINSDFNDVDKFELSIAYD